MEINKTLTIDLSAFGGEGEIVMAPPSFRKQNEAVNAVGKLTKSTLDGKLNIQESQFGDIAIISVLTYVKSAPFNGLEEFLQYADTLDEKRVGSAQELFAVMSANMNRIQAGDLSPFVDSAEAETPTSG